MNKFRFTIKLLVIATFLLAFASLAQAQASRTWVSGVGDDANPCSRTAPCKTWAGAISKTAANGEIDALDPGGFGAVTITKSITLDGTTGSGFGSILSSLVNGVIVNAGANDTIILRNLSINGFANGLNGIRFLAGRQLVVDRCTIFGFSGVLGATSGRAIDVSLSATANVIIKDTTISNCTVGIRLNTGAGFVAASIENVHIDPSSNTGSGIELQNGGFATIKNSVISRFTTGINVTGGANSSAELIGTSLFSTTTGLAVGGSTSSASASSFLSNTTGISLSGGTFKSGCDNFFDRNANDISGGAITNACVH